VCQRQPEKTAQPHSGDAPMSDKPLPHHFRFQAALMLLPMVEARGAASRLPCLVVGGETPALAKK